MEAGAGSFQPQAFQDSVRDSLPFFPLLPAAECAAKPPLLSAQGPSQLLELGPALHSSLGRRGRSSTLAASAIALWDLWHTLQWAAIPASSKENMFLPFKAKFWRGQDTNGARSYKDISLPASIISPRAVLAPGLGIKKKSGEGLWLGAATGKETLEGKKSRQRKAGEIEGHKWQPAEKVALWKLNLNLWNRNGTEMKNSEALFTMLLWATCEARTSPPSQGRSIFYIKPEFHPFYSEPSKSQWTHLWLFS